MFIAHKTTCFVYEPKTGVKELCRSLIGCKDLNTVRASKVKLSGHVSRYDWACVQ